MVNNSQDNYLGFGTTIQTSSGTTINGIWGSRLIFDSSGDLVEVQSADGYSLPTATAGDITIPTTVALSGLVSGADTTQQIGLEFHFSNSGIGENEATQFASPFEVRQLSQNGYPVGSYDANLVTYSSSNPQVATINSATGEITPVSVGETTIRATIAESHLFEETIAEFNLIVVN